MSNRKISIDADTKFNPEDERIFCPLVAKSGATGHGLLKKHYIPHLDINICEYCEVEEKGQKNNLHYYQTKKQSKHLINELKNWREEILHFQKTNENSDLEKVRKNMQTSDLHLMKTEKSLDNCQVEIKNFKKIFDEKLVSYVEFLQQILQLKDLLQELKFDENGNLNVIAIGSNKEKEAKFVWMSLLFSKMKLKNLNPENFGLTEETTNLLENFVELFIKLNEDANTFVGIICQILLPQVAELEKRNLKIDKEIYLQRMPKIQNEKDIKKLNELKIRVNELENIILSKDETLKNKNSELENLLMKFEQEKQKIMNDTNKINKTLLNEVEKLNKINSENLKKIEELKRKLAETEESNSVVSANNQENNTMVSKLAKKLEEISELNKDLKNQLNTSQIEKNQNKKKIIELEEIIKFENSEKVDQKKICAKEISELRKDCANWEERYKNYANNFDLINSQKEKFENSSKDSINKIEKLQIQNKQLSSERGDFVDLSKKYENLNFEKKDLLTKYNMFNEEILNLRLIISEQEKLLNLEKQENANKIFEYNLLMENLKSEINDLYKKNEDKLKEIKSLESLNNSLIKNLEENQFLLDDNNKTLDRYTTRNQDLTLLNSKFSEENSHLKTRIEQLENLLGEDGKKNKEILQNLEENSKNLKNENVHLVNVIKEQHQKINNLNDQINNLALERDNLSDTNDKNKTYIENKEKHINEFLNMLKKSEDEKSKLKLRVNDLEDLLGNSEERENLSKKEISKHKENLENLKGENSKLNISFKNLQKKHDEINDQNVVLSAGSSENNTLVDKLNKKLDEVYKENEKNKNLVNKANEEIDKMKENLKLSKKNYDDLESDKNAKIKELDLLVENKKKQNLSFEKVLKEKDLNVENLIKINNSITKERDLNGVELMKLKGELPIEKKKSAEVQEKLNSLEKENLKIKEKLKELEQSSLYDKENYHSNHSNLNKNYEILQEENEKNRNSKEEKHKKIEELEQKLKEEKDKNNKFVEDIHQKLNKISAENSELKKQNIELGNELDKVNSAYDNDIENYGKENNAQLLEFKNSCSNLENKLKEYAEKNRKINTENVNLLSENEEMKRKIEDIPILEERIYRRKMQEANNNIIIDNMNKEVEMLKKENESLRNQINENEKLSKSLRSSLYRPGSNNNFNNSRGSILYTTTNTIDPSTKNNEIVSEEIEIKEDEIK